MQVLHVSYWPPDSPGSYNQAISRFLKSNSAEGHSLYTVGPPRSVAIELAGSVYFSSGRVHSTARTRLNRALRASYIGRYSAHRDPSYSAYAADVVRFVRRKRPAVVVVYDDVKLCLRLATLAGRGYRLVLSQHGTDYNLRDRVSRALYGAGRVDGVVVLSSAARDLVIGKRMDSSLAVHILPNAVDAGLLRPPNALEALEARRILGIDAGPVVGLIGRLTPNKGVHEALEAVAMMRREHPGLRFLIAGSGANDYVRLLRLRADESDLAGSVVFAGQIDPAEVRNVYWACDLLLFPTLVPEGMPMVVIESLATGLPVVGYRFAAADDIGGEPDGLLVVDRHDIESMAVDASRLLRDAELRRAVGSRGRKLVAEKFDVERWFTKQAAILNAYIGDADRST